MKRSRRGSGRGRRAGVLLLSITLLPQAGWSEDPTGPLKEKAKQAHSAGLLDQEAAYLCEAAKVDPGKLSKRCDKARSSAVEKQQEFDGVLGTAKFELAHMDFPGAIRDLGKITFGPHHAEAQHLLEQAKGIQAAGGPTAISQAAVRQAQIFYAAGNFTGAVEMAGRVMTPALQPLAQQIVKNVQIYRETMAAADELARAGRAREAGEKYSFAMNIKADGPGDPAAKLQHMVAVVAEQQREAANAAAAAAAARATTPAKPAMPPETAMKIQRLLAQARHAERSADLRLALAAYSSVLVLDATQGEAATGLARTQAALAQRPVVNSAAMLSNGIRGYYQAHFDEAVTALSSYLGAERSRNQGAAHFYLGASLFSQALLGGEQGGAATDSQRLSAREQFRMARTAGYRPVETLVSPKILTEWTHTADQGSAE